MYTRLGTDISRHQGKPNFDKIKGHNVSFLFAKAGEYMKDKQYPEWDDPEYKRNRAEAKRVGIPFGAYYYFHANVGASDQARHFLRIINESEKPDFPLVVDIEVTDGQTPAQIANNLYSFISYLEKRGWTDIIIYTRNGFWVNSVGNPAWSKNHTFWLAHYPRTDIITEPFKYTAKPEGVSAGIHRIIWQFTERMQLPGLPNMDGNWWLGTDDEFADLSGRGVGEVTVPSEPPVEPPIEPPVEVVQKKVRILADKLSFRHKPELYNGDRPFIPRGMIVTVLGKERTNIDWYKVQTSGGDVGYISAMKGYTVEV